jgi:hypothetical protein
MSDCSNDLILFAAGKAAEQKPVSVDLHLKLWDMMITDWTVADRSIALPLATKPSHKRDRLVV